MEGQGGDGARLGLHPIASLSYCSFSYCKSKHRPRFSQKELKVRLPSSSLETEHLNVRKHLESLTAPPNSSLQLSEVFAAVSAVDSLPDRRCKPRCSQL